MLNDKKENNKHKSRAISSEYKNITAKGSIKPSPTSQTSRIVSKAYTPKNIYNNNGTLNSNNSFNKQDSNSPGYESIRNEKLFSLLNNDGKIVL
jgi:hypothetical protein